MIEKAGGIITRIGAGGEREIYLIHRPRYNDWSLPKGHIDAGETPGFFCTVVRKLPNYAYQLPDGEQSAVHFFEMAFVKDGGTKDTESDRGEWMTIREACERISYPSQQVYLLTALSK
jgi:8-oxo-dGTP diphosphatase